MSKDFLLHDVLSKAFPERPTTTCLSSPEYREKFVVLEMELADGKRRAAIREWVDGGKSTFLVFNPTQKAIYLLALDSCFFTDTEPKRCDCMLFDDQVICFVELKLDVTSRRQGSNRLSDARKQLGETIVFFRNKLSPLTKPFFSFELEAYIVMRTNIYPRHRAGKETRRVAFLDQYGVKLFEENEKTF